MHPRWAALLKRKNITLKRQPSYIFILLVCVLPKVAKVNKVLRGQLVPSVQLESLPREENQERLVFLEN